LKSFRSALDATKYAKKTAEAASAPKWHFARQRDGQRKEREKWHCFGDDRCEASRSQGSTRDETTQKVTSKEEEMENSVSGRDNCSSLSSLSSDLYCTFASVKICHSCGRPHRNMRLAVT